jgi:hypothetical protein
MKFIIMQFSPWSIFLPFRSKYPPQHSVLKKSSVCVPPSKWETKFRTHTAQLAKKYHVRNQREYQRQQKNPVLFSILMRLSP